ncbi:hypothetical protein SteCoe_27321 [Stentor coeruleus]|uniref:GRIP domain-containing protein n=1 Tax=Stentor coeruleus TaxID=5963 RepID=A0A1R2BAS9_9CILI|nr:hypothetical protein SteCoe_27321 [Stentor coeruleus]
MWSNIKNIASEAIVAAIDIKQHIAEVASDEVEVKDTLEIVEQDLGANFLDNFINEHNTLKLQYKDLNERYDIEKTNWQNEKKRLGEIIGILEGGLAEKDKEIVWERENYQEQLKEIVKSKNKTQREYEKVLDELVEVKNSIAENQYKSEEIEELKGLVKSLQMENSILKEERDEWKHMYENYLKNEEDKISRSFFIQFLSAFSSNIYNPIERENMINSLVGQLHFTNEEKSLFGIYAKPKHNFESEEKEISLFDKFASFLKG